MIELLMDGIHLSFWWIIDHLLIINIILSILIIFFQRRNPTTVWTWLLVLYFIPGLGFILYLVLGQNFHKDRMFRMKEIEGQVKYAVRKQGESIYRRELRFRDPELDRYRQLMLYNLNACEAVLTDNNDIRIYTDGKEKFKALLWEMEHARSYIHLQYYIFANDRLGNTIKQLLIDKVKEGVTVRVIYDDVGCWHVPNRFFEEMRNAGIEVRSFLKVRFPLFTSRVNYRNHRKIVVIDGRVGFVGGMNLAERYMRGFSWGIWRDTHIMLEGKAVHGLQTAFLLDWYFVDRTLITASRYFPKIDSCGSSLVQIVTSEPIGPWKEIMQGLTVAITSAKKYFYMQTPYFLPTEPILAAMQTAALSGVDIRLMLPERADNWITHLGSRSYLADVMQAGVKVYFYKKGFLHSKLMVSDDMLSTVGSTNVDFRSFEHNFEVNAFMYDVETALEMKEIFLQDQRESTQIFLKNWGRRSWRQKAAESIVRLLAPLL